MTAAAKTTRGGGVRGNDQASIDLDRCTKTWRRENKSGGRDTVQCEGLLVEVLSAGATEKPRVVIGYRCNRCSAQYSDKRQRYRDE